MKHNQHGFHALIISVVIVVLAGLGFAGWYVYHKNHDTKTTKNTKTQQHNGTASNDETSSDDSNEPVAYDAEQVSHIAQFDRASASLKDALISIYYGGAKERCDIENEGVAPAAQQTVYMTVHTMVRDVFASVQFCGAEEPSLLANTSTGWQNIGSLTPEPSCDVVDQFRISKELVSQCSSDEGTSRAVTYP